MLLKGKSQEDFWNWYLLPETLKEHKLSSVYKYLNNKGIITEWLAMPETCQNAIIIDWFDTVGIFISPKITDLTSGFEVTKGREICIIDFTAKNRKQAIKKAILEAMEIYNTGRIKSR